MRRLPLLLCLMTLPFTAQAARTEAINSPVEIPITTQATAQQVKLAAHLATAGRGWVIDNKKTDSFEAVYSAEGRRSFTCRIRVAHSPKSVTVTYVSSEGLGYDGSNINANYNKWMRLLEQDIPTFVERILAAQ